ncbi:glycosyl transferase group 1 [Echinicola pacifica]|uniref:Glycosyl transferase group 1 n=1 Tax=Echinicola pacifica TaxID=346377 RepID=A0A918PML4_9BACT|nr:glycosyltransferase family 4 protein [Echinicola pacifica]GGZ14932.1 glycosyl transferase group 1 [Echinicola pacifica]
MRKSNYSDDNIVLDEHDTTSYSIEFSDNNHYPSKNSVKPLEVLFVSSGNLKNFDLAPFIKVQGESLTEENINVTYFTIKGKGIRGYLRNIKNLKKFLKEKQFDLIHAHFTLSGWVAALSFPKHTPLVLSLMGTDALGRVKKGSIWPASWNHLTFLTYIIQPFVDAIISKSPNIDQHVWMRKNSHIIPNGVDLEKFDGLRKNYRHELGLKENQKYILFLGNPSDTNKNFNFLKEAKGQLSKDGFEIVSPYPVSHDNIVKYLSSVDMVVMCSQQEGSPNVVKEALASNCKGVFTNVGDVEYVIGNTPGYAITDFTQQELVKKIHEVDLIASCHGRQRLIKLGLDTKNIALRIKDIYTSLLTNKTA